jgi:hypothetical protein
MADGIQSDSIKGQVPLVSNDPGAIHADNVIVSAPLVSNDVGNIGADHIRVFAIIIDVPEAGAHSAPFFGAVW